MTNYPKTPSSQPIHQKDRRLLWALLAGVAGLAIVFAYVAAHKRVQDMRAILKDNMIFSEESVTGSYLAGRYAANSGDYANADYYLKNTLKYDSENREITGYAYRMSLMNGDMEGAVALAKQLYAAQDEGANPEIMVLLSYIKDEKYAEARDVLKNYDVQGFNLVIVPLLESWLELGSGSIKAPVKQNETLRKIAEFAPFIYYQTAIINDLAGFEEEALVQYNEALALSKTLPYRVVEMMANLHARRGEWDKVEALYSRYNTQNPDAQQKFIKTDKPERIISTIGQGVAEIFFSTATILQTEGLHEEALIYIQQVLYLNPDFPTAQLMRGTILEDTGRLQESLTAYDVVKKNSPYFYLAQIRKAYVLNNLEKSDEALDLLKKLDENSEQGYQIKLTIGDINMRLKQYDDAISVYSKAIEKISEKQPNLWAVYYARGISYERLGKWDMSEKDMKKALELQPDQPDVMNYLGYTWLTRGEHLEEARALLQKAVTARPGDAHIVDSMGWSLYALGEYDGAVKYLERAVELMPVDPTVNDHLGDAYWQLGRKNEARFQWKRALLFNPEADQEAMLNQKLQAGLATATPKPQVKEQRAEVTP